jgi:hypothetical protein
MISTTAPAKNPPDSASIRNAKGSSLYMSYNPKTLAEFNIMFDIYLIIYFQNGIQMVSNLKLLDVFISTLIKQNSRKLTLFVMSCF